MKEITKQITTIAYEAEDGRVFDNKNACLLHDWRLKAHAVWVVHQRGQSSNRIEVYSTEELALEACNNSTSHIATKIYVDERFWNQKKGQQ